MKDMKLALISRFQKKDLKKAETNFQDSLSGGGNTQGRSIQMTSWDILELHPYWVILISRLKKKCHINHSDSIPVHMIPILHN
jgi:hypothetical protein